MIQLNHNKNNRKRILFYSSVNSKKMFSIQQFYRTDICILRDLGYQVKLSQKLLDYFLFWRYDIAFIYFYRYGLFPALLSKLFRKKVIFTGGIDNLDKDYAGSKSFTIQKILFKLCILFSDKNILVSNSDKKNINNFLKILPQRKFPLAYHVIDFENYQSKNTKKKEKLFTTIAWMEREENAIRKGVDKSVYLFKKLKEIDHEYRMLIIGPEGEGAKLIKRIIEKEKLEEFITFTGAISEKEKIHFLKRSMIYSQLSTYEGFGIAAIEALAAGNIIVHTGKGGLKEGISDHGINIQDYSTLEAVIREIFKIQANPATHQRIIENGIQHVSENFRYERRVNDFKHILKSLE